MQLLFKKLHFVEFLLLSRYLLYDFYGIFPNFLKKIADFLRLVTFGG